MYYNGKGTKKNIKEALKWLQIAADNGESDAQYLLAKFYWEGKNLPKDTEKAMSLIEQAAGQGNEEAIKDEGIWKFVNKIMGTVKEEENKEKQTEKLEEESEK